MSNENLESQVGESSLTRDDLQQLLADFAEVYKTRNLVEREYKLVQKSKQYNGPFEVYRRMFEIYAEIQKQSHWTYHISKVARLIQALGFIVIVFTAVKFTWDASDRQRKHLFENWDIVSLNTDAKGDPIKVGRGRKEALEYLSDRGENLARLEATEAVLSGLNLPEVKSLQESVFQKAMLVGAYLVKANLYDSNFQTANLDGANLKDADLRYADFDNADLQKSCLKFANFEHAEFNHKTNLEKADFRGAKNLKISEIKEAKNYRQAIYSDPK